MHNKGEKRETKSNTITSATTTKNHCKHNVKPYHMCRSDFNMNKRKRENERARKRKREFIQTHRKQTKNFLKHTEQQS